MSLDALYPTLTDLKRKAKRRVPRYLWDYLDGSTGGETARWRSEDHLDAITLRVADPLAGEPQPDLTTTLLGQSFSAPIGVAPVGMSGAVWPGAEVSLARMATRHRLPYCLSTVAAATPEQVGPKTDGNGWFQLYAPSTPELRRDVLARARDAGFTALIFTVDVPILSRRPRELKQRLQNPMKITPRILWQSAMRPAWAWGMLGRPAPQPVLFDKYKDSVARSTKDKHVGLSVRCSPDWTYFEDLRKDWDGPLIVKGVLDPAPIQRFRDMGADAFWVSNHGGRQFEASRTAVEALPAIRDAVGPDMPLIADGGVRSGTDVLRLMALGADLVMLGRGYHWGLAAAGDAGADQVTHILTEEIMTDMAQLGINRPVDVRGCLVTGEM
jgi:L-lactate dehydrogenase (cytochrome)